MYIMELGLCTKHQELTIQGFFRQFWTDRRLEVPKEVREEGDQPKTTLLFRWVRIELSTILFVIAFWLKR